jgi:hypothetical protein
LGLDLEGGRVDAEQSPVGGAVKGRVERQSDSGVVCAVELHVDHVRCLDHRSDRGSAEWAYAPGAREDFLLEGLTASFMRDEACHGLVDLGDLERVTFV